MFGEDFQYQKGDFPFHKGSYHVLTERSESCGACHNVTNPLQIKNPLGKWVGGFTMERTYSEWANSRYADRPGNSNFDPKFKRDCQTCHMQQDYGLAGTGKSLYAGGRPVAPIRGSSYAGGDEREIYYSHHFIGGNTYMPRLIGETVFGYAVADYPELSAYSFSSADESSIYNNAYWITKDRGLPTQHGRLAWDRIRNAVSLSLNVQESAAVGSRVPLSLTVINEGSGHNFPTGFPEGRIAWVSVRAFDTASGTELPIYDAIWDRTSKEIGLLTTSDMMDPNFPDCNWRLPAGSPDPYAYQFKAVASLGDDCPTLALSYATPLNLVVNDDGMPIDKNGKVIDRNNPRGIPQYKDLDGDGDVYDDSFLIDTRLRPLPNSEATVKLDRYHVMIPKDITGQVAVTAAVYYQALEAMAAKKFLGNLADTDLDFKLEPGVLGGAADGREPSGEPAVVEGAPPVPVSVVSRVVGSYLPCLWSD